MISGRHFIVLSALFAAIGGGGCCSDSSRAGTVPAGAVPTTQEATAMEKPFMIHEAALPRGFPPPGPVDQVIVKQYPAYREAVVKSAALGNAGPNGMFSPLFKHIKKNDIAMTSPVEIQYPDPSSTDAARPVAMAFLYREMSWGRTGSDGAVEVVDALPVTVISVGIRGSYSDTHFKEALAKLNAFLAVNPGRYTVAGPPRLLGYNSPFVPWFLRFSELQIPVNPAEPSTTNTGR